MKRKILSFLAAGMLFTLPAAAQSVGVVMSGGGAKGLYHIGVLQALEESGIPIDYVSGTSMGSIIAGMYAAGYSPEEMRRIVASGVVKQWVSGRIDPSYLPYYRRNTGTPIFLSIRLNMKDHPDDPNASRFRLPSYLISSNQIDLALADLFGPATTASRQDQPDARRRAGGGQRQRPYRYDRQGDRPDLYGQGKPYGYACRRRAGS